MGRGLSLGLIVAAGLAASAASAGPRASRDLQGTWDLGSYTELERPAGVSHLVMTPAEAEAYEAPRRAMHGMPASKRGEVGQQESEWTDRGEGLARVKGEIRSSTIVDPPDGKLPYRPAVAALAGQPPSSGTSSAAGGLDNPEEMGGTTRCMATVAAGAPMLGAPDANVIQVMQTKDAVVILSEKYHDVRIVRLVATAAAAAASPRDPPSWLGSSVGWWEGDTLVVDTQGLRPGVIAKGQRVLVSGATRVTERFTRLSPHEIFYAFTVEDPALLTRPWRGEATIHPAKGPVFEYACHEGNYSMETMLAGARLAERETAAGK
ncbi:MAG TPA: hypothetical protein VGH86_09785 [Phenylobacterium sp.]